MSCLTSEEAQLAKSMETEDNSYKRGLFVYKMFDIATKNNIEISLNDLASFYRISYTGLKRVNRIEHTGSPEQKQRALLGGENNSISTIDDEITRQKQIEAGIPVAKRKRHIKTVVPKSHGHVVTDLNNEFGVVYTVNDLIEEIDSVGDMFARGVHSALIEHQELLTRHNKHLIKETILDVFVRVKTKMEELL
jgi:hypothetical protein